MSKRLSKRVLLIGWDAADWRHITPLLDAGLMPALERLVNRGVMGNISTLQPVLSPMLWNSVATGKMADEHGILGFMEPDPQTSDIRPVKSTSRKVKAIWNILSQNQIDANAIGWWASHPAEPVNGIIASDLFPLTQSSKEGSGVPKGAIHPEALHTELSELRIEPTELSAAELLPFVPKAAQVDQQTDKHLAILAKHVAEACSNHNLATWILQNRDWEFLAVYHTFIDHVCHSFMPFYPPKAEGVDDTLFELYKDVIPAAYRFHDMMLDTLLQLAGEDTTVILMSDHGFHSDFLRPFAAAHEDHNPALWHRQHGIFVMAGPGVKQDERIYGASLLDVCPTLLTLFGLPVGRDMAGKVLTTAFEQPPQIETIESWDKVPGDAGMHREDLRMDPMEAAALTAQFVALGYVEAPGPDQERRVQRCVDQMRSNLAQVYLDSSRAPLAVPILRDLYESDPSIGRAVIYAEALLATRAIGEASQVLTRLAESSKELPRVEYLRGVVAFEQGDAATALAHFQKTEQWTPRSPTLHIRVGRAYLKLKEYASAERAFRTALEHNPDNPGAHDGLALTLLRRKRYLEAAQAALAAVELKHHFASAHFHLGVAMARLGHLDRAILAFETATSITPGFRPAHRWLSALHRGSGNMLKAAHHAVIARKINQERTNRTLA